MRQSIYLIAGEASGDRLGAGAMAALRRAAGEGALTFHGVGGPGMEAEGLASLFPMRDLSLMGFAEILPHIPRLRRRLQETVLDVERVRPDILLTIDSPGFTFRVVAALRKRGRARPRFVHYVAPSVWAYRPERARKTAALFDHLLCLLPFEPPYFTKEGLAATFVGHPLAMHVARREEAPAAPRPPLLCLLPGSREGELRRHLPLYEATMNRLAATWPEARAAMPVPESLRARVERETARWSRPPTVVCGEEAKRKMFAEADAALAKSGTIALELAAAGLPMATAHRVHPASAWLLRRMIRTPYVNLVNILLGEAIVPELLQEEATPERLAAALTRLLENPEERARQRTAFARALVLLRPDDGAHPDDKAAEALLRGA